MSSLFILKTTTSCKALQVQHEFLNKSHLPTFMNDSKYFTPSFTTLLDQSYYRQNQMAIRLHFIDKHSSLFKNQYLMESPKIPMPKSRYCQICQTYYEYYRKHLQGVLHKKQSRESVGQRMIEQLIEQTFWTEEKKTIQKKSVKKRRVPKNAVKQVSIMIPERSTE